MTPNQSSFDEIEIPDCTKLLYDEMLARAYVKDVTKEQFGYLGLTQTPNAFIIEFLEFVECFHLDNLIGVLLDERVIFKFEYDRVEPKITIDLTDDFEDGDVEELIEKIAQNLVDNF